jgi:site-specific DNA-methyltransferase (adenine-specific)
LEDTLKLYYKDDYCTLTQGDCIEVMIKMAEKGLKFDAIITDLPYGTTDCRWDSVIPLDRMWELANKLSYDTSPFITTCSQPFTTKLISSNYENFKYCLVWNKKNISNPLLGKKQPLRSHEDIAFFYKKQCTYNPIMIKGKMRDKGGKRYGRTENETQNGRFNILENYTNINDDYYPKSILEIGNSNQKKKLHPTQKPIELYEWLIKTYTNEGDTILDFTSGSGTTLVASKKLKRKCYGIELEEKYCEITKNRLLEIT